MNKQGDNTRELDRIIFFSDAIFAIVMTLLILDIPVPEIAPGLAQAELPSRVLELWPKFFSYVLSFLVIGTYWLAHHGTYRYIESYDRGLMWLNLLFLLSISFVPFPRLCWASTASSSSRWCFMPFLWLSQGSC